MNATYEIPQRAWRAIWPLEVAPFRSDLVLAVEKSLRSLGAEETDTLVLAARRMTATYALLEEHGLSREGKGVVMSDRYALLSSPAWWRGRNVDLLDDTSLTGKTLEKRRKRLETLRELGSITARPAVELNGPGYKESELHDQLHMMYARAFSEGLLPYFTDFPISAARSISVTDLEKVWSANGWKVVDVSNAASRSANYKTHTLFPDASVLDSFWSTHASLARLVRVAKLRVFTRYRTSAEVDVRVVPITLINPVTIASSIEAARRLGIDVNGNHDVLSQAVGYIGYLIADRFMQSVSQATPVSSLGGSVVDSSLQLLVFGPDLFGQLEQHRQLLDDALSALEFVDAPVGQAETLILEMFDRASAATPEDNYYVIGDDLVVPVNEVFDHVKRGVEGRDVIELSHQTNLNIETASLALDVLNDLGLVVPEVSLAKGLVRRVFRPGEVRPKHFPEGSLGGRLARVKTSCVITERGGSSQVLPLFGA